MFRARSHPQCDIAELFQAPIRPPPAIGGAVRLQTERPIDCANLGPLRQRTPIVADSGAMWTEAPAELASRYITQLSRGARGVATTRWARSKPGGAGEAHTTVRPVLVDPYRLGTPPQRPMPNYLVEGSRTTRGVSR